MAMISNSRDIEQFLEILLQKMVKAGAITAGQKFDMKNILAPALSQAGGLDANDPKAVDTLKKGVLAASLCSRVGDKINPLGENGRELMKSQVELVALNFKDPSKMNAEEKRKYSMGMACLLVMDKDPKVKITFKLVMENPRKLSPADREKLSEELAQLMKELNGLMAANPGMGLTPAKIAAAIDLIKSDLEKNPSAVRSPAENKQLMDALTALFGMDPSTPGKITGPIQCMIGNALGIADNFPAMGSEPIHGYSGDILNAAMQSATGQYALDEDRENDLGVTFADNDGGKDPSALDVEPDNSPSAPEALTTAFAGLVEESAKETIAPTKEVSATKDADFHKPITPYDSLKSGPKPTSGGSAPAA